MCCIVRERHCAVAIKILTYSECEYLSMLVEICLGPDVNNSCT